jgi:hypothetical protein
MPIQGFGIYVRLLKKGHRLNLMGLKGTEGDVARWNSRVKLARNFRRLEIASCSDTTLKGYSAFFQVFLTHSSLERYLPIIDVREEDLESLMQPYNPRTTIDEFFSKDKKGKLFEFLHERLNPRLKAKLIACREGSCENVSHLSASIRHIFAHGHLAAHSHGIKPNQVASACATVSEFLLDFMEDDFTGRMVRCERDLAAAPR